MDWVLRDRDPGNIVFQIGVSGTKDAGGGVGPGCGGVNRAKDFIEYKIRGIIAHMGNDGSTERGVDDAVK